MVSDPRFLPYMLTSIQTPDISTTKDTCGEENIVLWRVRFLLRVWGLVPHNGTRDWWKSCCFLSRAVPGNYPHHWLLSQSRCLEIALLLYGRLTRKQGIYTLLKAFVFDVMHEKFLNLYSVHGSDTPLIYNGTEVVNFISFNPKLETLFINWSLGRALSTVRWVGLMGTEVGSDGTKLHP